MLSPLRIVTIFRETPSFGRRACAALSVASYVLAASLLVVAIASPAAAQEARVSLGVAGGVDLPLSPSDRFVPTFDDLSLGTTGQTLLVHQRPSVGMRLQLETVIGNLAIRYGFQRNGWRSDRIRCRPVDATTGPAHLLPNGEFDDRSMDYDCGGSRSKQASDHERRPRLVHTIEAATEIAAIRPTRVIPYASIGGGIALTTYQTASQNNALRMGVMALIGGGLRVPFDRNFSLIVETRYNLTLMARGGDYSLRAGRAVAAHKSVMSAAIDPYHAIQAVVGLRVRVR